MQVTVAESAGFCFGVRRAVERVYRQVEQNRESPERVPIYTYGPIIHNEEVVRDLESNGVRVVETPEELDSLEKGIVIIRSHGVSRHIFERLQEDVYKRQE